ncbi:hypothetical protein Tco_0941050 [Tanacetum coccineum]|uniref:Uncharacterized protein n=1 Tax=Tanacetum coccineum TaxID=301880 RepID=A0ABQ5DQB7_9ASTR
MNSQETQQVAARDEKWVPFTERVKISSTNVRLETIVPQKEETFQVVIDLVKNSSCFKAFTISTNVPEIFMQRFWYSIKKVHGTDSYEFLLANKKCVVNADVFRIILDICPRVEGVNFTDVPDDDTTLAFLIKLSYKGPLCKHTNMFVYHMHQPWRNLAAIINKCLYEKTASNDKLHSPKKNRGKGSQRKKTADGSQETVDVSEEFEPKPELVKRKTSSKRRVKKKVILSADDNIISDDPDSASELGKSISKTKAEEVKAARQVHTTHARIVTKSVPVPTKRRKSDKKARRQARDSQVLEAQVKELGSEQESEYSKEDKLDDEEKDDKEGEADDEDDETGSDENDIYKFNICVREDEDEEMLNAKVEDSDKGDEEITDASKADAEKTSKVKDDAKDTTDKFLKLTKLTGST